MDQLGITVFDVAVVAVALFGAALGMSAGFAHAVLFMFSWVAAGWTAWKFAHVIQPEIQQLVGSAELAYFASMLAVFVGALVILVMLTNALSRSIRLSPLRKPDRILGAGFGVLCTWAVLGTAFLFYGYLGPRQLPPAIEGSATFPPIRDMAMFIEPYMPPGLRNRLQRPGQENGSLSMPPSPASPNTAPGAKPPQ